MNLLRKLSLHLGTFFHNFYPHIMLISLAMVVMTAYLQYELTVNHNDLIYWKHATELCSQHFNFYHLLLLIVAVSLNIIIMIIFSSYYMRPLNEFTSEMSMLELKERYTKFIVLRLIARLDRIQAKQNAKHCTSGTANNVQQIHTRACIHAHYNMVKAVQSFRKDVRKILSPSETEVVLPVEDVFSVSEEEEAALRRAGYYKLAVEYTDEIMRSMVNPKN